MKATGIFYLNYPARFHTFLAASESRVLDTRYAPECLVDISPIRALMYDIEVFGENGIFEFDTLYFMLKIRILKFSQKMHFEPRF